MKGWRHGRLGTNLVTYRGQSRRQTTNNNPLPNSSCRAARLPIGSEAMPKVPCNGSHTPGRCCRRSEAAILKYGTPRS